MPTSPKHLSILPFVGILLFAPSAFAKDLCVEPATGCADGGYATPQQALDVAQSNPGPDTVRLGEATYTTATGYQYNSGASTANTLSLSGAGRAVTTLTRSTAGGILTVQGSARDTFTDLRVHLTNTSSTSYGIIGGSGDALRVDVDADPGVTNSEGIQLLPGSIRDVRITMAPSGGTFGFVGGTNLTAATDGIFDSTITADKAATVYGGSIEHSRITGGERAIDMASGTIDDVVARVSGNSPVKWGLFSSSGNGATWSVIARHLTVIGDDKPGTIGVGVYASNSGGAATESVDLRSSIVRGFKKSFDRAGQSGSSSGTANLAVHYSDFASSTGTGSGPGTSPDPQEPTNVDLDPLFVDAASGDLRLRGASPLIDAGDPAAPAAGEPATDLGGAARVVDGNGDGSARSDTGAFEYGRGLPLLSGVTASPLAAAVGAPIAFAAEASDPEGETVALGWQFDDGTTLTGGSVQHAFAAPGDHEATVTATDSAGAHSSAHVTVTVSAPPVVPIASKRAKLSALTLSPRRFRTRRGTRVGFKLDAAATVKFRITRCKGHTRKCKGNVRGSITRAGKVGVNTFRFRGRVGGKTLRPGGYRLTAAAGSSKSRARFRVRR
jgi:hypothetical protein